jgi:hypothetical protein
MNGSLIAAAASSFAPGFDLDMEVNIAADHALKLTRPETRVFYFPGR